MGVRRIALRQKAELAVEVETDGLERRFVVLGRVVFLLVAHERLRRDAETCERVEILRPRDELDFDAVVHGELQRLAALDRHRGGLAVEEQRAVDLERERTQRLAGGNGDLGFARGRAAFDLEREIVARARGELRLDEVRRGACDRAAAELERIEHTRTGRIGGDGDALRRAVHAAILPRPLECAVRIHLRDEDIVRAVGLLAGKRARGCAGEIDLAAGDSDTAALLGGRRARIGDEIGGAVFGGGEDESVTAAGVRIRDRGRTARGERRIRGRAGEIDVAARDGEATERAALKVAEIEFPQRCAGAVGAGIFAQDRMAVLDARDDDVAVRRDCRVFRSILGRRAELAVIDERACRIELGDVGVGAARVRLTGCDDAADLAADIDIARGIDADRVGAIVR